MEYTDSQWNFILILALCIKFFDGGREGGPFFRDSIPLPPPQNVYSLEKLGSFNYYFTKY